MPPRLPPISSEALKTIALVLHGEGRGCASRCDTRDLIVHALRLVRTSEGPLHPDDAFRWLSEEGGLSAEQALAVRELADQVARGREVPGVGNSPLKANILQIWLDRAQGLAESPFDRLLEALRAEPRAAAV